MDYTYVIKRPRITEKATFAMEEANRYSFDVDMHATKDDIKAAVQDIYKVRVVNVATQVHKGRRRRTRFGYMVEPRTKTAVVKLHPEDTIDLI